MPIAHPGLPERFDDLITLLALQGLANRAEPSLFVSSEFDRDWTTADLKWQEVYSERLGFRFRRLLSFERVLTKLADQARGLVVYDPALDASRWIAVTLAGLEGWLPASPEQLSGPLKHLEIKLDLRGKWSSTETAYGWAVEELLPRCNPSVAFNAGKSHDGIDMGTDRSVILTMDYAVAQKAFVFNLSPAAEAATYGDEKIPVPGYPRDAAMLYNILSQYKPLLRCWGWAEPEWTFCSALSKFGHILVCGSASNMSFHASATPKRSPLKQRAPVRPQTKLQDKYYLAFMTNEGDAPRVLSTMFFGGWLDASRGRLPINWGVNPMLLHDFPFLADYFYSTATKQDYFYAGVSGAGYVFVDQLPDVKTWAAHCKPFFRHAGIDVVDCWDEFRFEPDRYETFARGAGARMFTLLPREGPRIDRLPCGVPCLVPDSRVHYKVNEATGRQIREIAAEHPPPFVIPLYGGAGSRGPSVYRKIVEDLGPDKFEAVTLAEMASLVNAMNG